jgi:hypothetical protein
VRHQTEEPLMNPFKTGPSQPTTFRLNRVTSITFELKTSVATDPLPPQEIDSVVFRSMPQYYSHNESVVASEPFSHYL